MQTTWQLGCRGSNVSEHSPAGWCITSNGKRIENIPNAPEVSEQEQADNADLMVSAPRLKRERDAAVAALKACSNLLTVAYQDSKTGSELWKEYPRIWNEARAALALCEKGGQ